MSRHLRAAGPPLRRLLAPLLLALGAAAPLAAQEPDAPPLSLSDADGQQLTLETLAVRTATHGPLALTELEIRFRNPHGRRMEGRFSATLPEGATISRFAKEVGGELMEGEVVERLRANQVYDQILHQMRDPALLEQDQGNRFSARIFPIEAGATVRLVLGYSQLLPLRGGERVYTLPLRGMPRVGLFTYRGQFHALPGEQPGRYLLAASRPGGAPGVRVIERSDEQFTPDEDLEVRWRADDAAPAARVLAAGGFYVASFRPTVAPRPAPARRGRWVFYVDASASAAEGAEHRVRALERLLAALPAGDTVDLRAFDHHVTTLRRGTAAELARAVGPLLRDRLFLGGTDLDGVIRTVAMDVARRPGDRHVLVTDGVATLGRTRPEELRAAAATIPAGATVHALVLGARQDAPTLAMLTRGRGRVVAVPFSDALDRRAAEAAARLALPAGASFAAADAGAEWVLASGDGDVQPGDEVVVVGRLRPGSRPAPRLVGSTGATLAATGVDALPAGRFAPLLEREAMRAWLAELAEREAAAPTDSARRALAEEQVRFSVEHRVMIPRTTMLVLETEEDYRRFGLDRRGLSSILTVGAQGVELLRREPRKLAGEAPPAPTGPGTVVGRVVDAANGRPLAGVTVAVAGGARRVVTDAQGRFRLDQVAVGPQEVRAMRIGYETRAQRVRVEARRGATADFRLPASTVQLEAIVATGAGNPQPTAAPRPGDDMRQVREEEFSGTGRAGGVASGVEAGVAQDATVPPPPPPMAPPPMPAPVAPAPEQPPVVSGTQELVPPVSATPPPPLPGQPREALQARVAGVTASGANAGPPPRPQAPEWTRRVLPSRAQVDSLAAALAAEPRRRDLYNRLGEAQWALGEWAALRRTALAWQPYDPENPQVYEALGEAALQLGRREEAARAFGSLVEVAPARPELLQRAGLLLLRAGAAEVAVAPLRRSLEQRPDRANGYRHLALVLWRLGREGEAADLLEDAARRDFPDWYRDVNRVIREELGYVLRSWAAREPARRREIQGRAAEAGVDLERRDALRITLAWETDANDVDLHVVDPANNHVFYGSRTSPTGLELYEDITQGFGPEVVRTEKVVPGTYHVGVNYFSAGPMGVSRGVLVVMRPDAAGVARTVQILPFRLVEGGRDMRHLAEVVVR